MKLIPPAISRKIAAQVMLGKKHSPTLLFSAGIVSMVGSTVLACRATLKLEEALSSVEHSKKQAVEVKKLVDSEEYTGDATYTDSEMRHDLAVITMRGLGRITKLYAPSIILGGVGVACLTKSHKILQERNMALTAAYIAVDNAFRSYRERVIDRFGEETDRDLRYDYEEVDVIDEETGKVTTRTQVPPGEHGLYSRWFDEDNANWTAPPFSEHNWVFLRNQQNWANDMLRARGYLVLNDVYSLIGLSHTSAGAVVGWMYDRGNEIGDNYVDFGCWAQRDGSPVEFFNGREGSILLDFNVDGPIWQLIDKKNSQT